MTAMSLATLRADGILAVLGILVLLLVMSIIAIIRQPRWLPEAADEDAAADPEAPAAAAPGTRQPAGQEVSRSAQPAGAMAAAMAGQADYPPRHIRDAEPGFSTAGRPKVTGGPPWGPAPRPPGVYP